MQKLFNEVGSLDKRCYEKFALSEDLLMEHAANAMYEYIDKNFDTKVTILIVCGSGNNGADGVALSRLLYGKYDVKLYFASEVKSPMAKLQYKRVKSLGIQIVKNISKADVVIDCIFGTGLNKPLTKKYIDLIENLNNLEAFKISCDIPSGINIHGQIENIAFFADLTITMGGLKTALFSDISKDYIGDLIVANLGLQREIYEVDTNKFLLEKSDMNLPHRDKKNSHKGNFGHLNVLVGCKKGAGIIASSAAFSFGSGLVSVVCHESLELPEFIMQSHSINEKATAIALGMGLGKYDKQEIKDIINNKTPKVIDADLFYEDIILEALDQDIVLTPHPKEFVSLLKLTNIADISIEELQNNRFLYAEKFSEKYPKIVLLLKGANTIISHENQIFVNAFGINSLSKGGSGDVLSGLIGALLAQGYKPLDAAITSSLAHSFAARAYRKNNYSMSPLDLIEEIKNI